jgi:hypothetical protein
VAQHLDGTLELIEWQDRRDRFAQVQTALTNQRQHLDDVALLQAVVSDDLFGQTHEIRRGVDVERHGRDTDEHQASIPSQGVEGLLLDVGVPEEVERHVQPSPRGDLSDPIGEVISPRVESFVRPLGQRSRPSNFVGIYSNDGRRTGQTKQLDSVIAQASDTPHADRLTWTNVS